MTHHTSPLGVKPSHAPAGGGLQNRPVAGAWSIIAAALMFACMGALIKIVSASLSNETIVFFRNLFSLGFTFPWLIGGRGIDQLKTRCFHLHLVRCMTGLGAMYCLFYAVAHLKLSEAVLLSLTNPLFIPLIAFIWIGEMPLKRAWGAILIGFAGIALILRPGPGIMDINSLVGLMAGVCIAFEMVTIRRMSSTEPAVRIVFYFVLLSTLISAIPLLWAGRIPSPHEWLYLLLVGLSATVGQFFMAKGYSLAPAAHVSPFSYGTVLFAALLGRIFWNEALDAAGWAGTALICGGGVLTIHGAKPVDDPHSIA